MEPRTEMIPFYRYHWRRNSINLCIIYTRLNLHAVQLNVQLLIDRGNTYPGIIFISLSKSTVQDIRIMQLLIDDLLQLINPSFKTIPAR